MGFMTEMSMLNDDWHRIRESIIKDWRRSPSKMQMSCSSTSRRSGRRWMMALTKDGLALVDPMALLGAKVAFEAVAELLALRLDDLNTDTKAEDCWCNRRGCGGGNQCGYGAAG